MSSTSTAWIVQAESEEAARAAAAARYRVAAEALTIKPAEAAAAQATEGGAAAGAPAGTSYEIIVDPEYWATQAGDWVRGLMERFGEGIEVTTQWSGRQLFIRLNAADPSILIGRQGATLDAFQHVVGRALATRWPHFPEIILDVGHYREKRLQRLLHAAQEAAEEALASKRSIQLEPMSASERKYIHNAMKDAAGVKTVSMGEEPHRYLYVEPLEGGTGPAEGGGHRREGRGGYRDDRGGGRGGFGRGGDRGGRHGGGGFRDRDRGGPPRRDDRGPRPEGGGGGGGGRGPSRIVPGESFQLFNQRPKPTKCPFEEYTPAEGSEQDPAAPGTHERGLPRGTDPGAVEDRMDWKPEFFRAPGEGGGASQGGRAADQLEDELH